MNVLSRLKKFADKGYRDGYLRAHVGSGIALQILALRAKLKLSQTDFADRTGKKQTVISRLETGSGNVSVQTLLDIATGANVALLVQFVSYPEFLRRTGDMTERALQPDTIEESLEKRDAAPPLRWSRLLLDDPQRREAVQGEAHLEADILIRQKAPRVDWGLGYGQTNNNQDKLPAVNSWNS